MVESWLTRDNVTWPVGPCWSLTLPDTPQFGTEALCRADTIASSWTGIGQGVTGDAISPMVCYFSADSNQWVDVRYWNEHIYETKAQSATSWDFVPFVHSIRANPSQKLCMACPCLSDTVSLVQDLWTREIVVIRGVFCLQLRAGLLGEFCRNHADISIASFWKMSIPWYLFYRVSCAQSQMDKTDDSVDTGLVHELIELRQARHQLSEAARGKVNKLIYLKVCYFLT